MKIIARKYHYSFKYKITKREKEMLNCLKTLTMDQSIITTRPDRGNGVVLLNKADFMEKFNIYSKSHQNP